MTELDASAAVKASPTLFSFSSASTRLLLLLSLLLEDLTGGGGRSLPPPPPPLTRPALPGVAAPIGRKMTLSMVLSLPMLSMLRDSLTGVRSPSLSSRVPVLRLRPLSVWKEV